MVVFAMGNGALMPKLPYILPWHLFGSALVVAGTALLCQSPLPKPHHTKQPLTKETEQNRHSRPKHHQRQNIRLLYPGRRRVRLLRRRRVRRRAVPCSGEGYIECRGCYGYL